MKKFIIAIMCVFGVVGAYAENENAATSKEYVDAAVATKQPTIPAQGNNVVMTFDSGADDGIGTKPIYDETASYASQKDALVTATTANAAVQMAINGEFECVLYDPDNPTDCWWWNIKSKEKLPNGYTALEYLVFDNPSNNGRYDDGYINTGIYLSNEHTIEVKVNATDYRGVMGHYDSWGPATQSFQIFPGYNRFGSFNATYSYETNKDLVIKYSQQGLYVNNELVASPEQQNFVSSEHYCLIGSIGTVDSSFKGKIYWAKIWGANDTPLFYGVPAIRDSDGAIGMYDIVRERFLQSVGDIPVVAGPAAYVYLPSGQ